MDKKMNKKFKPKAKRFDSKRSVVELSQDIFTWKATLDGKEDDLPQGGLSIPTRDLELTLMYKKVKVTVEILGTVEGWD